MYQYAILSILWSMPKWHPYYRDIFNLMTENVDAGIFGPIDILSRHFELWFHAFYEPNSEYARLAYSKTFFYTQLFGLGPVSLFWSFPLAYWILAYLEVESARTECARNRSRKRGKHLFQGHPLSYTVTNNSEIATLIHSKSLLQWMKKTL